MKILGISAYYHDSAAAVWVDGKLIAALHEERFTRIKHDASFPMNACQHCLKLAGIKISEIDLIVFYEKPFLKFDRIIDTILHTAPFGFSQFLKAIPVWIKQKLWISADIRKKLNYKGQLIFSGHHEAHAASAFFSSPFDEAAIITIDGVGEWATTTIGKAANNTLEILQEQKFPHSLGLFYSSFTQYCGFKVNSGEYKLMGLAPYGKPIYKKKIFDHLIELKDDGSFLLNMNYFNFAEGNTMVNSVFEKLMGQPSRKPETEMTTFYMDVAASAQEVLEEIILKIARHAQTLTGMSSVCMAGGVALNCKANQKLMASGIFQKAYFYPASGDAGGAVGAAYVGAYLYHKLNRDKQLFSPIYLGNNYDKDAVQQILNHYQISAISGDGIIDMIVEKISEGKVIGWFSGKMEFGPRALGARSILADPRNPEMKSILNEKIKLREGFRPFAPAVLEEYANEYFEIFDANYDTMMVTATAKNGVKNKYPSIVHKDGTCRIQIVKKELNPEFYDLILSYYNLTGCPMLINTSFNVRGEPMVESPIDALRCFVHTDMDYLFLEGFIIDKTKISIDLNQKLPMIKFEND